MLVQTVPYNTETKLNANYGYKPQFDFTALAANWQVLLPNLNASQAPLLPQERERVHFPVVGEQLHDDVTHLPEILVLVQLSDLGHSHRLLGDQAPVKLSLNPMIKGTYIYLQ